ncbi:MAG: type II toxin-antitoxin system HigB family toxin [Bacteroidales bacterium]|nr:type II toxin-antitoxin system HigB family toxin [Bacteroidales bacterium]
MRVISRRKLEEFYQKEGYANSRVALERWFHTVSGANWRNFADMRQDFPSADYMGNQHYVFNIKGNQYRLVVVVMFTPGLVYIRWVGTHAEYDKIDCSTI